MISVSFVYVTLSLSEHSWESISPPLCPRQVLQAVRGAHVLLHPHVRALVPVGGVSVGGVLHPGLVEVHPGAERHLAGQQRSSHVGKQTLRQEHQPQGEQVCHLQRHRYESRMNSCTHSNKKTKA